MTSHGRAHHLPRLPRSATVTSLGDPGRRPERHLRLVGTEAATPSSGAPLRATRRSRVTGYLHDVADTLRDVMHLRDWDLEPPLRPATHATHIGNDAA